jgi:pyruvate,water dikinase
MKILLKGIGASPGIIEGFVRIVFDIYGIEDKLKGDDILVTSNTDPNWTIYMNKFKAIITDTGGILSHAAIVAREFGIPCIVGTIKGTEVLKEGMHIKIDGLKGIIYEVSK